MPSPDPRIYSHSRWEALLASQMETIKHLSTLKGGEYAGDEDRLANFRRNAQDCGLPMEVIWRVYAGKHWDAISQFIKDLATGKERPRAEPIEGRVDDLLVYLLLLKAILAERADVPTPASEQNAANQAADISRGLIGPGSPFYPWA